MIGGDRDDMRRRFRSAWRNATAGGVLEPLDALLASVVEMHPEYHPLLENDAPLDEDYEVADGRSNPFLHMGLHVALREQLATDRPPGVCKAFEYLRTGCDSEHDAAHRAIDCLAEALWQAQRDGRMPDEQAYLACLRSVAGKSNFRR